MGCVPPLPRSDRNHSLCLSPSRSSKLALVGLIDKDGKDTMYFKNIAEGAAT